MKKNLFILSLAFASISLFSCKKTAENSPPPASITKPTDVYVAGYNNGKIVYWKNGVETTLATAALGFGTAYSMVVSGKDVYVAGEHNSNAVYWKNGDKKVLASAPAASFASVKGNAIAIINK